MRFSLKFISVFIIASPIACYMIIPKGSGPHPILRTKTDIKAITSIVKVFKAENFSYPTTNEGLGSLVNNPNPDKYENWRQYTPRIPIDPWGNKYKYLYPGLRSEIDIFSLGSDRVLSKDDIGNWDIDK